MLLVVNCFAALLLWVSDAEAFKILIGIIFLGSFILFSGILIFINLKERKRQELFRNFITSPDDTNEERLLRVLSHQEGEQLKLLYSVLRENQIQMGKMTEEIHDYEEYVEAWAHEAKTPLSLLTMILDNRADEIPDPIHARLDYVRSQLQEDITQMLYYARLKSSTKDYRFENVNLRNSVEEVLEDYAPLLEEKEFTVENNLERERVFTDSRGLQFMLGQIISNAVKYSREKPKLTITMYHTSDNDILSIADNGNGVKSCDLPYIFQKGFTGNSDHISKKATGMGLYLTKKMADDLNLKLDAESEWGKGFKISIKFPLV